MSTRHTNSKANQKSMDQFFKLFRLCVLLRSNQTCAKDKECADLRSDQPRAMTYRYKSCVWSCKTIKQHNLTVTHRSPSCDNHQQMLHMLGFEMCILHRSSTKRKQGTCLRVSWCKLVKLTANHRNTWTSLSIPCGCIYRCICAVINHARWRIGRRMCVQWSGTRIRSGMHHSASSQNNIISHMNM